MSSVGRYELESPIGEGAMAEVYRAHDPDIERPLAVKFLRKDLRDDKEIVSRFLSEAKAAGALSHPGIVTIYDVGEADGVPYIAMELLEGKPLSDILGRGCALPVERAISYGRQLAEAIDYAHARGVVHRDIKPSNIWVSRDGKSIKLLDFGIARRSQADQVRAELEALRTHAGQVLGTPRYMSPEQALGRQLDHRTDFFSLGTLMYEMLTGVPAFEGEGLATIAIKITQESPVPLIRRLSDCPKGLIHVVNRLMDKSPEKRFSSGAEIADALRREERALADAENAPKRGPSYATQLLLQAGVIIGAVLILSFGAIHARQNHTMNQMISTSGSSMASFIAKNAALDVADNAGLAPGDQDWLALQEFISSAASDSHIAKLRVIDGEGVVRASSDTADAVAPGANIVVSKAGRDNRLVQFEQPIIYAGTEFGSVELMLDTSVFRAASRGNGRILAMMGVLIFAAVMAVTLMLSRRLVHPLRILRAALNDMTGNNFNYRISHSRRDEFGDLFDSFNDLAANLSSPKSTADEETGIETPVEPAAFDPDATVITNKSQVKRTA